MFFDKDIIFPVRSSGTTLAPINLFTSRPIRWILNAVKVEAEAMEMKKYHGFLSIPSYRQMNFWLLNSLVILAVTAEASYDFPTYHHTVYKNQLCYKCPPGYKKTADCDVGRDATIPNWPKCLKCESGQYMDK